MMLPLGDAIPPNPMTLNSMTPNLAKEKNSKKATTLNSMTPNLAERKQCHDAQPRGAHKWRSYRAVM